eukprot:3858259-Pleurochrysis_carterae.AAC.1
MQTHGHARQVRSLWRPCATALKFFCWRVLLFNGSACAVGTSSVGANSRSVVIKDSCASNS